jgi:hypothetical protein
MCPSALPSSTRTHVILTHEESSVPLPLHSSAGYSVLVSTSQASYDYWVRLPLTTTGCRSVAVTGALDPHFGCQQAALVLLCPLHFCPQLHALGIPYRRSPACCIQL